MLAIRITISGVNKKAEWVDKGTAPYIKISFLYIHKFAYNYKIITLQP